MMIMIKVMDLIDAADDETETFAYRASVALRLTYSNDRAQKEELRNVLRARDIAAALDADAERFDDPNPVPQQTTPEIS
jgi:hypothetical protein